MTLEATEETKIATKFSRKERQRILRDHLVRSRRVYNEVKALKAGLQGQTQNPYAQDAAPDWVWKLADAIFERTLVEADLGIGLATRAIAWCVGGDSVLRSEHLRELIRMWIGPRADMLRLFLAAAEKTNGGATGRTAASFKKKALRSVHVTLEDRDDHGLAHRVRIDARGEPVAIRNLIEASREGLMNGFHAGQIPEPPPPWRLDAAKLTVEALPKNEVFINDLTGSPRPR